MKKIIGIHGLANKPEKELLTHWWLSAINEGLSWINAGVQLSPDDFQMQYWASKMYIKPLTENSRNKKFKLSQTYQPSPTAPEEYDAGLLDYARINVSDYIDDYLDKVGFIDYIADALLAVKLKDLAVYWNETRAFIGRKTAKQYLCSQLKKTLAENQGDEILLIAHSMGSIIAYDTLVMNPDLKVDTLITIGSPLGLPRVKRRALSGNEYPVIPDNIGQWYNFADKRDVVAVDTSLRDDYRKSDNSTFIEDDLIVNEYTFTDKDGKQSSNYHKSYGYLRTPELAEVIKAFLI
jgi:PGAP1-like protein